MHQQTELQNLVVDAVRISIEAANEYFGESLCMPDIRFDLKGKSAGQARFDYSRTFGLTNKVTSIIRFNSTLMEDNPQAFIHDVAPHESAHVIANHLYGRKIKPHGREWKMIMRTVLEKEPTVTHRLDVSKVSPKPYGYSCACEGITHSLSLSNYYKYSK